MPTKHCKSTAATNCSIAKIQNILVEMGEASVHHKCEQGAGSIEVLQCLFKRNAKEVTFSLRIQAQTWVRYTWARGSSGTRRCDAPVSYLAQSTDVHMHEPCLYLWWSVGQEVPLPPKEVWDRRQETQQSPGSLSSNRGMCR